MCHVMVLLVMVTGGLITAAAPSCCELPSCFLSQTRGEELCICNVSRPYEEFCPSDVCIYPVLPELQSPLKKEDCDVTWSNSDGTTLAYPHSSKFLRPVTNISVDHLTTEDHVEGLTLRITCNDEAARRHRYHIVFTAPQGRKAPDTAGQPGNLAQSHAHIWIPVVIVLVILVILAVCIFAVIYWKRNKSQRVSRSLQDHQFSLLRISSSGGF